MFVKVLLPINSGQSSFCCCLLGVEEILLFHEHASQITTTVYVFEGQQNLASFIDRCKISSNRARFGFERALAPGFQCQVTPLLDVGSTASGRMRDCSRAGIENAGQHVRLAQTSEAASEAKVTTDRSVTVVAVNVVNFK